MRLCWKDISKLWIHKELDKMDPKGLGRGLENQWKEGSEWPEFFFGHSGHPMKWENSESNFFNFFWSTLKWPSTHLLQLVALLNIITYEKSCRHRPPYIGSRNYKNKTREVYRSSERWFNKKKVESNRDQPKLALICITQSLPKIGITSSWPKLGKPQVDPNWDLPKLTHIGITPSWSPKPKLESPQVDPNWDCP